MIKNHYTILAATLTGLIIMPGSAVALDLAVGAHGGTMGTCVEVGLGFTDFLSLRAGTNSGEYEIELDIEDPEGLDYENPNFDFDNQYLMLDVYPFAGKFHVTAGYFKNNNTILTSARVDDSEITIGGQQPDIDTAVSASISFDVGAYAGFGWGNTASGGMFNFGLDIGVVMQGAPQVDIDITEDPPAGFTITEDDIAAEEDQFEEENKDFDMWPVINLSFSIQFL
jgi:hypothetical protein